MMLPEFFLSISLSLSFTSFSVISFICKLTLTGKKKMTAGIFSPKSAQQKNIHQKESISEV
jgi:hypothetical protein